MSTIEFTDIDFNLPDGENKCFYRGAEQCRRSIQDSRVN